MGRHPNSGRHRSICSLVSPYALRNSSTRSRNARRSFPVKRQPHFLIKFMVSPRCGGDVVGAGSVMAGVSFLLVTTVRSGNSIGVRSAKFFKRFRRSSIDPVISRWYRRKVLTNSSFVRMWIPVLMFGIPFPPCRNFYRASFMVPVQAPCNGADFQSASPGLPLAGQLGAKASGRGGRKRNCDTRTDFLNKSKSFIRLYTLVLYRRSDFAGEINSAWIIMLAEHAPRNLRPITTGWLCTRGLFTMFRGSR